MLPRFRRPQLDADVRKFFRALGPATIGSAGMQLALFADTIIASFLATGALSALYYADRLNQLPIGVIGIAAGTVLLPEMARRIAAGDEAGARHAQNRAIELTLLLSVPCVVAFLIVPDLIMRALFMRGAFTAADAHSGRPARWRPMRSGSLPFVLIRSVTATFFARGDTATPVKALFVAVAVNVALQDPADGIARAGRPRARDLDRRVDQSRAGDLVRVRARDLLAHRRAPASARCSSSACCGHRAWRVPACSLRPVARWLSRIALLRDETDLDRARRVERLSFMAVVVIGLFGRQWFEWSGRFRGARARLGRWLDKSGRRPVWDTGTGCRLHLNCPALDYCRDCPSPRSASQTHDRRSLSALSARSLRWRRCWPPAAAAPPAGRPRRRPR